jgi:non-specific serine/threonine protein kinase/serine/threonine-protein kinase
VETERWQRIERLYHLALEQEKNHRAAFVEQACGGDESLQRELELLLAQESTDDFLEKPALELAARDLVSTGNAPLPAFIGRYRIIRLLGEGGMGTVYEAEQEDPRRIVALKVIRPGLATPERLRRFKHESQALGRLQHPGIAQIYEASTADAGFGPQPYLAMELIRGQSLEVYREAHQLNTRKRLELMVKICEAVHHAHQRGLIHRDLKPGNILVDETGQPKILDFGVARLAESDAHETQQTELGELIGTLAYMSPEQALGDPLEVDTRSDVYSLGVILYELLSGRLPYDVTRRQLHQAVQTIREEDPTSLSSIRNDYRGDIETIVDKALEKDRARRYASAADLATDIQRYLNDEPIAARPPTAGYQLQKFARRHRALVGGVAAVFVVLVAGVAVSTSEAIRANRAGQAALTERDRAAAAEREAKQERDRALQAERAATNERNRAVTAKAEAVQERNHALTEETRADDESATAKAINNFLQQDLLAQASANKQARRDSKPDPDLKVRTALDRAAAGIEGKFGKQPLVEASIRQTIGVTYRDLGLYPEAQHQLEAALSLRRHLLSGDHPDTLSSMNALAVLYAYQSKLPEAESMLTRVMEIRRRVLGEGHPSTLESIGDLAQVYDEEGKYPKGELLLTKILDVRRRVLGEDHPDTLHSMTELGWLYQEQAKYTRAEPLVTKALSVQRRVLGESHPDTLYSMHILASLYKKESKYAQAEPLYTGALEGQRGVLGESHPDTLDVMNDLAELYWNEGKYAPAETLYNRVLEIQRQVLGDEHSHTLVTMNNLAALYQDQGKYAQAEPLAIKVLEVRRRTVGEEHPFTATGMNNLAILYGTEGKYGEAAALLDRALAIRRRVLGVEHPRTLLTMANLATVYRMQGKYGEAEPLATRSLEVLRGVAGEENSDTLSAMKGLGLLYRSEGKYAQAEQLLTKLVEARRRTLGAEHPDTLVGMYELGVLYSRQGRCEEAEALFTRLLEVDRRVLGPARPYTTDVMAALGDVQLQMEKYVVAETVVREALSNWEKTRPDSWQRYYSEAVLGASLAGQRRYVEAEPLLVSGQQGLVQREASVPADNRRVLTDAGEWVVRLYESWGRPEMAARWQEKVRMK